MSANIVMMCKNEADLLMPWLVYHGSLFGYRNLTIVDNGSDDTQSKISLDFAESQGATVIKTFNKVEDYPFKGEITRDIIKTLEVGNPTNFYFPLDCDEFIGAHTDDGEVSFSIDDIESALSPHIEDQRVLMIDYAYDNHPLLQGYFRPSYGQLKCFFAHGACAILDHGSHNATSIAGQEKVKSKIVYMHYHFKPHSIIVSHALAKLRPFIPDLDSRDLNLIPNDVPGAHLLGHLKHKSAFDYYSGFRRENYIHLPQFGRALADLGQPLPFASAVPRRVSAIHPSWRGNLLLSNDDDRMMHEEHKSQGSYELNINELIVKWDQFPEETFYRNDESDVFVHSALLDKQSAHYNANLLKSTLILNSPRRVKVIHPHWRGNLLLSNDDDRMMHEEHKSQGRYKIDSDKLLIAWDLYPEEIFRNTGEPDTFIHNSLIQNLPNLHDASLFSMRGRLIPARSISVTIPGTSYQVMLRLGGTDVHAFEQIFVFDEYESDNLPDAASIIFDLGANIGLSSIFFGRKYPSSKIIAVEPDIQNFELLERNTTALSCNVVALNAAIWSNNGTISLETSDINGADLGAWGVRVSEIKRPKSTKVKAITVSSLMQETQVDHIDILKIDIEGAELEVFSSEERDWLLKTDLIIIETHDRFRAGSEQAVTAALSKDFARLPPVGENLFFRRRK